MAARIESRLARSSRLCSAAVRLPTSRIGCVRALHKISSVAAGDIDDDARRVNELLVLPADAAPLRGPQCPRPRTYDRIMEAGP
jgi:hypothetical protein